MKYYLIAGEPSGDLHASNLMKQLALQDPEAQFRGFGGDLMLSQGLEMVQHIREISFMGFVEVLTHLNKIFANISVCKSDILQYQPDVIICIDYPGFNLRISSWAHAYHFKTFYYISPQVWAWKQSRVKKIKKVVDRMFVILPFEKDFYQKWDYSVDFVGHPLLDAIESKETYTKKSGTENPIIALLPGSRKQEIAKSLKRMLEVIPYFPKYDFIIAGVSSIPLEFYEQIIAGLPIRIQFGQTHDILRRSEAALVTSGTATLETAIIGTPQVVCYQGNPLSFYIAKKIVNIQYISLVNLIMGEEVVKELIQEEFTVENLRTELTKLLEDKKHLKELHKKYQVLKEILGGSGASLTTAKLMIQYLNNS